MAPKEAPKIITVEDIPGGPVPVNVTTLHAVPNLVEVPASVLEAKALSAEAQHAQAEADYAAHVAIAHDIAEGGRAIGLEIASPYDAQGNQAPVQATASSQAGLAALANQVGGPQ